MAEGVSQPSSGITEASADPLRCQIAADYLHRGGSWRQGPVPMLAGRNMPSTLSVQERVDVRLSRVLREFDDV
jgi:hypothetical protein